MASSYADGFKQCVNFLRRSYSAPAYWDQIGCVAALAVLLFLFVWRNLTDDFSSGVHVADDGYHAVVAKALAFGQGYGAPTSSHSFSAFAPAVGSGPALMIPLALAINAVGVTHWLPGAVSLLIVILQIATLLWVLQRHFGIGPAAGFVFAGMLLALLGESHYELFGAFLGEPTTLGYLLVGTTLMALSGESLALIALAGLSFSLAFLTKQIAAFSCAGMVFAWLSLLLLNREPRILLKLSILVATSSALPFLYELVKLISLGWQDYLGLWSLQLKITGGMAIGTGTIAERLRIFAEVLDQTYVPLRIAAVLTFIAIIGAVGFAHTNRDIRWQRLSILLWSGVAGHFLYLLFLSTLWTRYFWIGIALAGFAIATPVLVMTPSLRMVTVAGSFVLNALLGGFWPSIILLPWRIHCCIPVEQATILKFLSDRSLPFAGNWASFYDIVYLSPGHAEWAELSRLGELRGKPFVVIIQPRFLSEQNGFYQAVTSACEPVQLSGVTTYKLYVCPEKFWELPASSVNWAPPP